MESTLIGKKILLCISGSIAAYKSAFLCRLLIKHGCDVKVVMTPAAEQFISGLTMSTLSKNSVYTQIFDENSWNNHVELGLWADAMLVAPATASTLAKLTHGIADNMLIACYLSAKCPVFIAPAMDLDMWVHPSTTKNINTVQSYGNYIIPVGYGELASGLEGDGRMAEPEEILNYLSGYFKSERDLDDKKVLITAGPTYEALDPVRFIGNRSSGKMGYALANECASRGAKVMLISGPTENLFLDSSILVIKVESADEMYAEVSQRASEVDVLIFAAAVADYKPETIELSKIKKSDKSLSLKLVKTKDIALETVKQKHKGQLRIGFALETNEEINNALHKLHKKNFDFIVLNSLNDEGAGFQHDTNKIRILTQDEKVFEYPLKSKREVAKDIIDKIVELNKNEIHV